MNKREKQAAETISDIMRESEKLFVTQGFENTTVQQIADKCKMTKGALYHHFKSKEEVLEKLLVNHYEKLMKLVLPIINSKKLSFIEKLKQVIGIIRKEGMKKPEFLSEQLNVRKSGSDLFLKEKLKRYDRKFYLDTLKPVFEEGIATGECEIGSSAKVITLFIFHLDRGLTEELQNLFATESPEAAGTQAIELIDTFVNTISDISGIGLNDLKEIIEYQTSLNYFKTLLNPKRKEQ